ncbi:hypothetical protein CROQUDRAFT_259272 [Cronartium quercuum f. sp. fusiforme G11]|uniref:Uncharacterized protein n=1 Tax=Cronartium quercuum f. sp. fusiforme G11 TaxID=708437 RepID=A0A9P6ND12_9BASI|nr:hypothetical protein CROQUDRAFT_259272 [Cronartium quercuum f. sp. fusiforme G11]
MGCGQAAPTPCNHNRQEKSDSRIKILRSSNPHPQPSNRKHARHTGPPNPGAWISTPRQPESSPGSNWESTPVRPGEPGPTTVQNSHSLPPPVESHLVSVWDSGVADYYGANIQWWGVFPLGNNNPVAMMTCHNAVSQARNAYNLIVGTLQVLPEQFFQEVQT